MGAKVPQGVYEAYMVSELLRLAPPNAWWKYSQSARRGVLFWTLMLLLACVLISGILGYPAWLYYTAGMLAICLLVLTAVAGSLQKGSGAWRRYSPEDLLRTYDFVPPQINDEMWRVRAQCPAAEFKIEVLEQKGEPLGYVLFQTLDTNGMVARYAEGGDLLLVLNKDGKEVTLDEGIFYV